MRSSRTKNIISLLVCSVLLFGSAGYVLYANWPKEVEYVDPSKLTNRPSFTPKLATETIVEGLNKPWDVSVLTDGTVLFTEKAGELNRIIDGKKVAIGKPDEVRAVGEGGLLGLAVDPDFATTRSIYMCYTTSQDTRVSRWRLTEDFALTDQKDIIIGMPLNTTTFPGRHSGCRPVFGPDGYLWIGTGDVAVGEYPQDKKNLGGKVLRVDRDGNPVEGNLGEESDPRVYSYGHRNIQGLAFSFSNNGVIGYSLEHGSSRDDEVNELKIGNFGWDPVPNYNESVSMTDTEKFPDAISAVWTSGFPTIAPSGGTIISGSRWGKYDGSLAMAILKDKHIRVLTFDGTGKRVVSEDVLFKDVFGRIRTVHQSFVGDLYITTDNGNNTDKIIRITTTR